MSSPSSREKVLVLLAVAVPALLVANRLAVTAADFDLWGYLAFGRLYWRQGFPYADVFAYTPTLRPWVYHEWLTGVVYYPIHQALGMVGLQALRFLVAAGTCLAVFAAARVRRADFLTCGLFCFVAGELLVIGFAPVRAQIFTYLFFAVFLWRLEAFRADGRWRRLAWLPLLMFGWANLHGGFLAGLGLVGLYAAGALPARRGFWPLAGCGALCALATLVNPYGPAYWTYLVDAIGLPRPDVAEWASVWRALSMGRLANNAWFFLGMAGFALFVMLRRRRRDVTDWLVLGVTAAMAAGHLRHQIFFILAFAALLPSVFADGKGFDARELWAKLAGFRPAPFLLGALAVALAVNFVLARPWRITAPDCDAPGAGEFSYPVEAVRFLRERISGGGRVLAHFNWGEWLSWNDYPFLLVAMDGRYETVYPRALHEAYFRFVNARPGWREFLVAYPPDVILLSVHDPVIAALAGEPGWRLERKGRGSLLFVRTRQD
ncbi:hypothetical protein [Solidesulfovibrio sp.]|uniref:hypothetical protein n=1 Tax=Solidesulfovibrio sp. TaxID=2910990 RepID=UPI00262670A5|nr:hypothetical protein [Solidesulfovibrio sp.]